MRAATLSKLLTDDDPDPVEVLNPNSDSPILLLCEHAGRALPSVVKDLGVSREVLDSHRGWDIGAENVARRLATHLGAPLIIQRYSRLVIDANRPPKSDGSIPLVSDGVEIRGNQRLRGPEIEARIQEIFVPMDDAIRKALECGTRRFAFSIHSFTRVLNGQTRPWHAGFLSRTKSDFAKRLMGEIQRSTPDLALAVNQPYQIDDETDWFIPIHVEPRDIAHSLIEIRNDLIASEEGAERWARYLAQAITACMEDTR